MKVYMKQYSSNILVFWNCSSDALPQLSKLARQIDSIAETNTVVRRQFSSAGLILAERRTNLGPQQLDNILFIRAVEKMDSK